LLENKESGGMVELIVEERKINFVKMLGILGAVVLIIFGSVDNIWRTVKLAWGKVIKE
jgi:hypothetical protein